VKIEVERRLLGQVAIGRKASEQMHAEVDGAAVTRVLDLADVLELVDDGLNGLLGPQTQFTTLSGMDPGLARWRTTLTHKTPPEPRQLGLDHAEL
jgi:hypothetical protein